MATAVVGVVGAGTMGAGIAQVALEAGHEVVLHDVDAEAIERGRERIADGLTRRAGRLGGNGRAPAAWIAGRLGRVRAATTLDAIGAEAGLGLVVEAALEDLGLKQLIFRALDEAAPPDVILATNTSALSVADIAAMAVHRERVIGLHFFNPAPVMPLVEVVAPPEADGSVVDAAADLVSGWGKTPVRVSDSPGFIVNRVNRPFTIEALRLLETGAAGIERIDEAIRGAGFPMGPFELMDLTGIDVTVAAATSIWERLGRPDRLRPSPIAAALAAEGQRGRKDAVGFYRYEHGVRQHRNERLPHVPGGIAPAEIVATIRGAIRAEAEIAVAEGIATPDAIALALRLGAGHPSSPFEG